MKIKILAFLLLLLPLFTPNAHAVTLAEFTEGCCGIGTANPTPYEAADIDFNLNGYWGPRANAVPNTLLFENVFLTSLSAGQTFTATSTTDPAFDNFVSKLTNGVDDLMYISMNFAIQDNNGVFIDAGGGGGYGMYESDMLGNQLYGGNGVDFLGFDIDTIALRINSIRFSHPFAGTTMDINWTLSVEGPSITPPHPSTAIPEPSTILLMLSGLLGLPLMRKNR